MKVLVVLVLLGAAAVGAVYYFGAFSTFDPTQQGETARKAITPGMTLNQVVAAAGVPREFRQILLQKKKVAGQEVDFYKPGAAVKFDMARVQQRIAANELPHGFVLPYAFSRSVAFQVEFDGAGTVVRLADMVTEADLLQLRE